MSNKDSKEFYKRELANKVTIIRKFLTLVKESEFEMSKETLRDLESFSKYMMDKVVGGVKYHSTREKQHQDVMKSLE